MDIEEYQKRAVATALPTALNYYYLIPGLVAEVGEVFGKVAKAVRDDWHSRERLQEELKAELGDVCWFWILLCYVTNIKPREAKAVPEALPDKGVLQDFLEITTRISDIASWRAFEESSAGHYWLELYPSYIARVAMAYGIDMQEILEYNINKLESRKQRGTLKGSGDVR